MALNEEIPVQYRMDGATGEVRIDGNWQADVINLTGSVRQDRREVRMSGRRRTAYKGGGVSGEGSLRFQKVDDRWEHDFFRFASMSLAEQRAARDRGENRSRSFPVLVNIDDPDAVGASMIKLEGVIVWEMPIGFDLGELIERELPITWEKESIVSVNGNQPLLPYGTLR